MRREILYLSLCQALFMSCVGKYLTLAPLIGASLVTNLEAATVPVAFLDLAILLSTYLASVVMFRIGRKRGLISGVLIGATGALICMLALKYQSFLFFCIGSMGLGVFFAHAQYFRFVAAEIAGDEFRPKAISYVLAGGLGAAFVGPYLTLVTRDSLSTDFAGNYVAILILCLLISLILRQLRVQDGRASDDIEGFPRLGLVKPLFKNRFFVIALFGGLISYGSMALIMTATPLAMQFSAHDFGSITNTIQWHFVGMFAPSFFTGNLISRFGTVPVIGPGCCVFILSGSIAISGVSAIHFVFALMFAGIGWNFMFIGASNLLVETVTEDSMKAAAQGVNETAISAMMIIAAVAAGVLHSRIGWAAINVGSMILITLFIFALLATRYQLFRRLKMIFAH